MNFQLNKSGWTIGFPGKKQPFIAVLWELQALGDFRLLSVVEIDAYFHDHRYPSANQGSQHNMGDLWSSLADSFLSRPWSKSSDLDSYTANVESKELYIGPKRFYRRAWCSRV